MAHKRNIFIINPEYQFKFCLFVLGLIALGSLSFPLIIFDVFNKFSELQPGNEQLFLDARNNIFQYLLFSQVCYLGIAFVICVYLSHKTAGPIYKLKLFLKDLRSGELVAPLNFRQGDYFQDLAEEVNLTVEHLKNVENSSNSKEQFFKYIDFISIDLEADEKEVLEKIKQKIETL